MPEPPPVPNSGSDRAATGSPANGTGDAKFAELLRALLGDDLDQIAGLKKRLDDPSVRSSETGKILPAAIKAAPAKGLRDVLEPVLERSFRNSVRKNPKEIGDAIYPAMRPAIRLAIEAAIRDFAESLNQIIEKSASWRAISWRIEARATGKPFTEILLARSLRYAVEQVFLIHIESGVLLMHVAAKSAVVKDADMVSGMFTVIQDFVSDSFVSGGQSLNYFEVGGYKFWTEYGAKALLVGAVSGSPPVELRGVFRTALEKIQETLLAELQNYKQGDLSVFEPARPYLESCLLGQRLAEEPKRWRRWLPKVLVIAAAVAVILLAAEVFLDLRNSRHWDAYVDQLRTQPGIAVLRVEKIGSVGRITGLKDPKAPEPSQQLKQFGLNPSKVQYDWQPYLSLNTTFATERAIEADVERVHTQTIRFDLGSPKLPLAEAGRIEDLAAALQRIRTLRPGTRVTITGHTDEMGLAEANLSLSLDRAQTVSQALTAQGVPSSVLRVIGAGNSQPVRTGGTEWDQAANRSVSLHVDLGPVGNRSAK